MAAAALAPELLVQLDPGRFRADNLLGAEDWDHALYGCHDDRLDPAPLFPSLDPDPMFDSAFDGGGANPPDPPWHPEPPRLFPDLQVKSEPDSDSSCTSEPQIWSPKFGVKPEPLPPLPCTPPEPPGPPPRGVKAEGPPQSRRTPPIQPRPGGGPQSPPKTVLLQPLPGGGVSVPSPALLLPGGLLCLPRPPPAPPKPGPAPGPAPIAPGPAPGHGHAPPGAAQLDVRALRRQQRRIKNRESASASRRRRREYLEGLEQRLHLALQDNERLRRDNGHLRRRLLELQGQSSPPPRNLAVLGVLLLLVLHLGPLSLPQTSDPPLAPPPPPRGRRHLLGLTDLGTPPKIWGPPPAEQPRPHSGTPFRNSSLASMSPWDPSPHPGPLPHDCRGFNRTESLRLADELRVWVQRHQSDRGTPGGPPQSPPRGQLQGSPPWKAPEPRWVPAEPPRSHRLPPGQLLLYPGPAPPEPPIPIERRNDTFYVVSFGRDHLLLPARSHNKTSRPKMSLVMPAAALNESAMMQVDCEVIDTRVIHVPRPRAPSPARATPTRRPRTLPGGGDGA